MKPGVVAGTIVAAIACAGCGSGTDAACGKTACGGDIVGRWAVTNACTQSQPVTLTASFCPQATVRMASADQSGTFAFNQDLTFSMDLSTSALATWFFPSACLQQGLAATCGDLGTLIDELFSPFLTAPASCSTASGGCSCKVSLVLAASFAGTYSTSGSSLTLGVAGLTGGSIPYCVNGRTLTIASMPAMTGASGMMGMNGPLVLIKE